MEHISYKNSHPDATDVPSDNDLDPTYTEEQRQYYQALQLHQSKCPEGEKGVHHQLMKLAWTPQTIETLLESDDNNLIYTFYRVCVSRSVGKRKWNVYSKRNFLH